MNTLLEAAPPAHIVHGSAGKTWTYKMETANGVKVQTKLITVQV